MIDVRMFSSDASALLLARIHDQVLLEAFGDDERMSIDELVESAASGTQTVTVAEDGDRLVGAAVCHREPDSPVELLSYLAVVPDVRGRGVGSMILEAEQQRWRAPGGPELVLGEIHDPRCHATTARERPGDRVRFYAREGASLLDLPWTQPPLRPGALAVGGMLLIVLHPINAAHTRVDQEIVARWIDDTWADSSCCTEHHEAIRSRLAEHSSGILLHELSEPIPVEPLTGLDEG